jgi:hypothetical protein
VAELSDAVAEFLSAGLVVRVQPTTVISAFNIAD